MAADINPGRPPELSHQASDIGGEDMDYKIQLEKFEGPLDLLLHLIRKHEVDIYDIPLAEVTRQYLEYIWAMQELDLEIASEFLVMAATLMEIKMRNLLPRRRLDAGGQEELDVDPREELIARLIEYKKFKEASRVLDERLDSQELRFFRQPPHREHLEPPSLADDVTLDALLAAFGNLLESLVPEDPREVYREEITMRDKMGEVRERMQVAGGRIGFSQLFTGSRVTRLAVVVTFLAVLELVRRGELRVLQDATFDEILLVFKGRQGGNNGEARPTA